jgi:hypothetical protein
MLGGRRSTKNVLDVCAGPSRDVSREVIGATLVSLALDSKTCPDNEVQATDQRRSGNP